MQRTLLSLTGLMLIIMAQGCDPHARTKTYIVEPPQHTYQKEVIVEEVTVVETYTESYCSPVLEQYYSPYYHIPEGCTDYGHGTGYCCTWHYVEGHANCADEWCFWEDTCTWEPVVEECVYEYYEYEYY